MARKKTDEAALRGKALQNELRVKYLTDFISLWQRFYAMFDEGTRSEQFTEEQDQEFLKLKGHIAQLIQLLSESMGSDIGFRKRVLSVITDATSLRFLATDSPVKINDMRAQWNEVLIAATKLLGRLKDAA